MPDRLSELMVRLGELNHFLTGRSWTAEEFVDRFDLLESKLTGGWPIDIKLADRWTALEINLWDLSPRLTLKRVKVVYVFCPEALQPFERWDQAVALRNRILGILSDFRNEVDPDRV